MVDPKEYIIWLRYLNYNNEWSPTYDYSIHPETWKVTYGLQHLGKCFTPILDPEMIKKGIRWILIKMKSDMRVYVHNPGVFHTKKSLGSFQVYYGTRAHWDINYKLLKLLTFHNETCIDDPMYNRDQCTHERVYKVIKQAWRSPEAPEGT